MEEKKPDLFLRQIVESKDKKSETGRLKIFFGYAAGIGKTYAMLKSAHRAKESGIDVVCGYIEPHTRPETMELTEGLEALSPKSVDYHGIRLLEFDLEAALFRHPDLILVDELAHSNVKGGTHAKRYQDIKELLKAGIHVYTTVNVQHLESLNDTIADITGVTVRERVPDSVFDEASQVEMVDLEPDELLERLQEGKVYKETQASRAMANFFTRENLTSLREVALRRMADRVNHVQDAMIHSRHETVEHLMVCLSPSPSNGKVIRQAARMANAFHGKLTALYVERQDSVNMSREDLKGLNENTRLAEQLGAKVVTSYGNDIVEEIAAYAKVAGVSKIVLGRTYTKRRLLFIRDSVSEQLSRLAPNVEIFLVPDAYDKKYKVRRKKRGRDGCKRVGVDAVICLCSLVISTLVAILFSNMGFSDANLVMVYILGVLTVSIFTRHQAWGILTSIMSILVFNFFFTQPVGTFSVNDPGYFITFFVMFVTSLCSSALTKQVKNYARQNSRKAYRTELLLETSRKLQEAVSAEEIATRTMEQLGMLLERNIYFYMGKPSNENKPLVYKKTGDAPDILEDSELGVAQWTYRNNKHAGFSTQTLPGSKCLFLSVRSGERGFAVVGIDMENRAIPAFEEGVMGAILNECAFALEKETLLMKQREIDMKLQKEQLRANLLRSISHDLRTPLTSISGNAETLLVNEKTLPAKQRKKIYTDIYDDSMWLINLVENLLSVTRIENGAMELNIQGEIMEDVIDEALHHVNRRGKQQEILVDCDELLMVKMDVKLMIQVILNLVDNAVKYAPSDAKIIVGAKKQGQKAVISVANTGPGIPDDQKPKLFQMFYTGSNTIADGRRGMGLGLMLCKAIVNAHGSELKVYDNIPAGTVFQFELEAEEVIL